ncbi:hypothetical protein IPV09_04035 [Tessaracoccus sp. SD287]|uniref:hypothetical protein n=1 Tax=Tessaracoccus sp. SD287 TaxID=2782008 RepID=UPI001A9708EE|nr:hypothetical protein [Tessaracoccus sp. SD287]MBO1030501.1 hypothetical protein [Tessaracoccus sp. SD287]
MAELQVWGEAVVATAIGATVWNERTVLATDWSSGALHAFTVETGEYTAWGDGYLHPEGIAITGDAALVVEQAGVLLHQDLLNPGRANATTVATGLGSAHAVVWVDDVAHVTDHAGGRILAVTVSTGAVEVVVDGLAKPLGLLVGEQGEYYVTEQGTGALTRIDPDGARTTIVSGLVSPFLLSWTSAARAAILVTERAPAHRVGLVDLHQAPPTLQRLVGRGISQPSQALICRDRLVVTGAGRLISMDATRLDGQVHLELPDGPLWPGAWVDVPIDTGVTGYTRADLDITVQGAPLVEISTHPAVDADPTRPTIRLLAGALTGATDVVASDATSGEELGRATLTVDFDAGPLVDGPPLWLDNPTDPPLLMKFLSSVPGTDDAGQLRPRDAAGNVLADWRVVMVLVDTNDALWPTTVTATTPAPTVATAQTTWRDWLTAANGVDTFFTELSGGRMGMTLVSGGVLGPVNLGGTWGDWHVMKDGNWAPKDEVLDRVVGALQGTPNVNWTAVDAVFMVMRSAGGNFVWPRASIGRTQNVTVKNPAGKDTSVKLAKVTMPHNHTTVPTLGFTHVELSSHELGHTLGLDDIYMSGWPAAMAARDLGQRELMGNQQGLPHLCARHKTLLGFLDPGHVRSFTVGFAETNILVDLVPVASGPPPAGRFSAIEVRIAPRLSWYFELRQSVPARIGDTTTFPAGGEIIGYDAISYERPAIIADTRRPIILLLDDGDGQGPLLATGEDYESLDAANQNNIQRFMLEVVSITAGVARVRINIGRVDQPDPVLLNNAGELSDHKSPDIEIRHAVSDVDPTWLNKPLVGEPNRVVAKVHNEGGLAAPNVSVRFQVLPFNTDDKNSERWTPLPGPGLDPRVTHDVPAGATVEFQVDWQPPEDRHYCVQARIDRYVRVPGAAADEPDVDNNLAQSNYFEIFSKPKSPATREVSLIEVHNPFHHPIDAQVEVSQDSTKYRSYVDHRWLHLMAGQTRMVRLEVESKATSIWDAIESHWPDGRTWLRTWLPGAGCTATTGTGVTLGTITAVESTMRVGERGHGTYWLLVQGPDGAPPPPDGTVVVRVVYEDGQEQTVTAEVEDGTAMVQVEPRAGRATAWYSGTSAYAPIAGWEFEVTED